MPELLSWHHMPAQDVLLALQTSVEGLKIAEASRRLEENGPNRLRKDKPTAALKILVHQLASPIMLVLMLAVALSLTLGKYADTSLTLAVILINILMGFAQEYRADRALHALRNFLPSLVTVRRAGSVSTVPSEQVVVGDILLLAAGNKIPADARILSQHDLAVNEAALTGESAEVTKQAQPVASELVVAERSCLVFAGSTVVSGKAEVVVVATGLETEFGKVTELVVATPDERTPLQSQLLRLSRILVLVMLGAAATVFVLGSLRGISFVDMLSTSAALAVAAVPEGLLVSVTVILTVGMRRMLKRQALVRRLVAAETLGSVNVLCVDKTGTLTTGEMTVSELRLGTAIQNLQSLNESGRKFLQSLKLANACHVAGVGAARKITGSATEVSLMAFLLDHQDSYGAGQAEVIDELPFQSETKFSAKLVRENGQERLLVMGAPDVLLARCDLADDEAESYRQTLEDMAGRGLRVMFLADKVHTLAGHLTAEQIVDLRPIGLVGLQDPLRSSAKAAIVQARSAGVRVIMITGDHPITAAAIAGQLELPTAPENIILGSELAAMNDEQLLDRLRSASVFARVLPEQKLRIVKALQGLGYAVAMTGDGVNDAPALRAADIGVAVGSGTEVAKETADMVLLDNDVNSIVAAIREGRIIFDNIRKVLAYLLTFSLSEVVLIAGVIALGLPVPFAPLHILWINLVTDGLPSVALAFEPGEQQIMKEPPRPRHEPLLTNGMRRLMFFVGSVAVTGLLLLYIPLYQAGQDLDTLRSLLFLSLGLDSLLAIFPLRSLRQPFWKLKSWQNPQLLGAVAVGLILLLIPFIHPGLRQTFGLVQLAWGGWGLVVGIALAKLCLIEIGKAWFLFDVRKPKQILIS